MIRNQAKGYQANYADRDLLDAGELPDVEVTISTPLENLNTAVEWDSESGNATKQLPYRAYLYNYSDGTYVPVEKTKNDEYTEEYLSLIHISLQNQYPVSMIVSNGEILLFQMTR